MSPSIHVDLGAGASARTTGPVVASVPAQHVYVRHLAPEQGAGPVRLPDPDPADPRRSAQQRWWPPVMLTPAWAAQAQFDLMHLQFGFDATSPSALSELVGVLDSRGKPLVYTVHDLRNPHHLDRAAHDAQLDVLVPAASALVTLTAGAAEEIRRRWGRNAQVVPHPHVVPFETMARAMDCRARRRHAPFRVGLHVKSLRASMDPTGVLPTLIETVKGLPGAVLQVNGHREVLDPGGARHDVALTTLLTSAVERGELELHVHDFLDDDALWGYLTSLDVSVLPYRFGTHSGWLEACRDLGTTVIAPSCGYFAEQGPVLSYVHDETGLEPATLADAVRQAYQERPRWGASVEERRRQRALVSGLHADLYERVLA